MPKDTEHSPGYETRDVDVGAVLRPALALFVVTVVTFIAMTWMLGLLEWRARWLWERGGVQERSIEPPPEPRLQVSPSADFAAMWAEEERLLSSYGWIDRKRGVTRIPVERAIELLASEGLPAREGGGR